MKATGDFKLIREGEVFIELESVVDAYDADHGISTNGSGRKI